MRVPVVVAMLVAGAGACSDPPGGGADAAGTDAATDAADTDAAVDGPLDAPGPDAPADGPPGDGGGVPLPGFGAITGPCGVLGAAELDGTTPLWFEGEITFADRYDDPAERGELTQGGLQIILDGNAGGSSLFSEVFAYEWLARCELASLIKTENQIVYDLPGAIVDLLVDVDGRKVGVSVTRAVTFPFGNPYTLAAATTLLERKLDDIQIATAQVSAADRWSKQMVSVLAYDVQHAQVARQAWSMLDDQTRDDTLLVVTVTSGDDLFIYTDQ